MGASDLVVEGVRHDATAKDGISVPKRRGVHAKVAILIPAMTALGHADAPATLQGFGPIDIETAKRLAARRPGCVS